MEPGIAGNWAQFIIFVGLCFGWVGSYLYRVATKVRQQLLARCLDMGLHGFVGRVQPSSLRCGS